jgi:hypothetical protein
LPRIFLCLPCDSSCLVGVAEAEGPAATGHHRCRPAPAFRPYRHPPRAARLSRQCTCAATKDPIF